MTISILDYCVDAVTLILKGIEDKCISYTIDVYSLFLQGFNKDYNTLCYTLLFYLDVSVYFTVSLYPLMIFKIRAPHGPLGAKPTPPV